MILALGVIGSIALCGSVAGVPAGADSENIQVVSYSKDVQPIFDANCVACHQTNGAQENLVLEEHKSYSNIVNKPSRESGALLIAPSSPDSSYLIRKIEGTQLAAHGRGARMPLDGSLEAAEIAVLRRWVEAGAKDD